MGKGGKKKPNPNRYATQSVSSASTKSAAANDDDLNPFRGNPKVVKAAPAENELLQKYAKKTAAAKSKQENGSQESSAEDNSVPKLIHEKLNPASNVKLRKAIDSILNPAFPKCFTNSNASPAVEVAKVTFPLSFSYRTEAKLLELLDLKGSPFSVNSLSNALETLNVNYLTLLEMGYSSNLVKDAFQGVGDPFSITDLLTFINLNEMQSNLKEKENRMKLEELVHVDQIVEEPKPVHPMQLQEPTMKQSTSDFMKDYVKKYETCDSSEEEEQEEKMEQVMP